MKFIKSIICYQIKNYQILHNQPETPWSEIYKNASDDNLPISKESIAEYYLELDFDKFISKYNLNANSNINLHKLLSETK